MEYDESYMQGYMRTLPGSVALDFKRLFNGGDDSCDVVLQDGDIVYVPMAQGLVRVIGGVKSPGYFRLSDGADYRSYIELAGGFNWNADRRNVLVYKASSNQQQHVRKNQNVLIEGGDTILVMEKQYQTFWSRFTQASGLVTTLATLAVLTLQITGSGK
jgi:hypothetical protein